MKGRISFSVAVGIALLAFTAPANATPVACGDTITTTTVLDSDVVCPDDTHVMAGVFIGADNVTLWLGGHTIRAGAAGGMAGVLSSNWETGTPLFSGVHVRGGRIEGFQDGVLLYAEDSSVRGLRPVTPHGGIKLYGDRNLVTHNTVEATQERDIGVPAGGWSVSVNGDNAVIESNRLIGGPGAPSGGIAVGGDNFRIVTNTIEQAGQAGISVGPPTFGIVALNVVTCSSTSNPPVCAASDGIEVIGGGGTRVRRNTATGLSRGIKISGPAVVWNNTANANYDGIAVLQSWPGQVVKANTANNNFHFGFYVAEGTTMADNTASGNLFGDCIVHGHPLGNYNCGEPPPS